MKNHMMGKIVFGFLAALLIWGMHTQAHAGYCWITTENDYSDSACRDSDTSTACSASSLRYYVSDVYYHNSSPNCTPTSVSGADDGDLFEQVVLFATYKSGNCGDGNSDGDCNDSSDVFIETIELNSKLTFDSNNNISLMIGNWDPDVVADTDSDWYDDYVGLSGYVDAITAAGDYGRVHIDGTGLSSGTSPFSCSSDSDVSFRHLAVSTNGVSRDSVFTGNCKDGGDNLVCSNPIADPLTNPSGWCDGDGDGYTSDGGNTDDGYDYGDNDCNDSDSTVHPGATETCGDSKDNDCDGQVDDGCSSVTWTKDGELTVTPDTVSLEAGESQVFDVSLSGVGGSYATTIEVSGLDSTMSAGSLALTGDDSGQITLTTSEDTPAATYTITFLCTDEYTTGNIECSDTVALTISAPATTDEDCDDAAEADEDGDGDANCDDSDCDSDPSCTNDEEEDCDDVAGADEDGDGDANCDDSDCDSDAACTATDTDADNDGYIDENDGGNDCNDSDASINPGADEVCDDIDNDCDGTVDGPTCIPDVDGDGYGDENFGGDDCDDTNADINPGETELCTDGDDNNCDGKIDGADTLVCSETEVPGFGEELTGGGCSLNGAVAAAPTSFDLLTLLVMVMGLFRMAHRANY